MAGSVVDSFLIEVDPVPFVGVDGSMCSFFPLLCDLDVDAE